MLDILPLINVSIFGLLALLVFKFRSLFYMVGKYWWYGIKGGKLVIRINPNSRFATFDVWTPDKSGSVTLKEGTGKQQVNIEPNSVLMTDFVKGQMLLYREGDSSTLIVDKNNVKALAVNSEFHNDAVLRAEREGFMAAQSQEKMLMTIVVIAAIAAGIAAGASVLHLVSWNDFVTKTVPVLVKGAGQALTLKP